MSGPDFETEADDAYPASGNRPAGGFAILADHADDDPEDEEVYEGAEDLVEGDDIGDFAPLDDADNEDDEVAAEGNRLVGAVPKGVLEYVARHIVDDPEGVFVEVAGRGRDVELRLHVAPADMGKVIGRRGRVAQALRQVVAAAGTLEGVRASLDIVD